jgi:MFS family permease
LFLLGHVPLTGSYWMHVMPGFIIMGLGAGASFVSITIAATSGVAGHEAGLASGLINTTQQIGGALGLAILSGVAASHTSHALASGHAAPVAILGGYHAAYYTAVGFAIGASVLAALIIKPQKIAKTDTTAIAKH